MFRAAARAHRATGAPIMTHTTHFGELALEQLDLLADEGVAGSSVIVSHLGDRPGIASIRPIAERGAWLGIDNLGFVAGYASLETRADNVVALWDAGYGDRILLASDICRTDQLVAHGGAGYASVLTSFLPLLRERRLDDGQAAHDDRRQPGPRVQLPDAIMTERVAVRRPAQTAGRALPRLCRQ